MTAGGNWRIDLLSPWSAAGPDVRQWADANREVLALYRRASELPDALVAPPEFEAWHSERGSMADSLWDFQQLAFLEGSRLEAAGDMAGAWGWYRANLRTIHLVGLRSTVHRRNMVQEWHRALNRRVGDWAVNPRTTRETIRQALDDVLASEALRASESHTLKAEYLDVDRLLDLPDGPTHFPPRSWVAALPPLAPDLLLSPDHAHALYDAWRFTFREPERSRRVLRQAFANWLAYYDLPESARPRPDPSCYGVVDFFYPPAKEAKAPARALAPQDLTRWLSSSLDANVLLPNWPLTAVRRAERTNHRDLVIMLGEELYRRDHGAYPRALGALVGPYLKNLPPEFRELRDETVPEFGVTRE